MKRHRVMRMSFDTRALFIVVAPASWEPHVREQHEANRRRTIAPLEREYGSDAFEQKLKNFEELGPKSFSVFVFHNDFLEQARHAFVIGAYYPAATGACALRE